MTDSKTVLIVCDSHKDVDQLTQAFRGVSGVAVCHLFRTYGYRADVILRKPNPSCFGRNELESRREAIMTLPSRLKDPNGQIVEI